MILMILAPLIGVMGAILLSFGVWMIYPPGGLISAGMLCLIQAPGNDYSKCGTGTVKQSRCSLSAGT